MMVMGMLTKITRNAYANLLLSPKSKCVFPSSAILKNTFHQRSSIISENSTISPCHLQKICSPNGVVSRTTIQKGFFPNPVVGRRLFSNALWKQRRSSIPVTIRNTRSAAAHPRKKPVFQNVNHVLNNNNQMKSPSNFVATRFCNSHIAKRRRYWYQDPTSLIILAFLGCWAVIPLYYWTSETVPYAKRGNFMVLPTSVDNKIGELYFEELKSDEYKRKIVGSHHPQSIRVKTILQDIIEGLMRNKFQTSELFNWEIIIMHEPTYVSALSAPGGKIVIYTGLLNHFKTDAEIATIIAHEVGHVVARHTAEKLSVYLWLAEAIFQLLFYLTTNVFLRLPPALRYFLLSTSFIYLVLCVFLMRLIFYSPWKELEADYIGMLISASAGYDPRIAPQVYVKLENVSPSLKVATHPHGNKRAELLSQPKVMEEALAIYTEALNHKDRDKDEDEDEGKE